MLRRRSGGAEAAVSRAARRAVHFRCPTCSEPLRPEPPRTLRCAKGHSVDVAKEGHCHLVPAGRRQPQKAPKVRGDTDGSIRARRSFFEAGHYQLQASAVAAAVGAALGSVAPDRPAAVLDAGCGEGQYLRAVERQLGEHSSLWGTDLSRLAVRYAAKRQPRATYAIAASHRLPFDE